MKKALFLLVIFIAGLFSVNAADMIVLKDGNVIEAKIMEMHPNEIRYKRADNLNGPMVFLPKAGVFSIKYENGVVEIVNDSPSTPSSSADQQMGVPTSLQAVLNTLPAIPIAGNNLKFQFSGDNWTAMLNGENFWAGTVELEDTEDGSILNLKQTHMWPAAAGKAAGRLARRIPGGSAVGGALDTAGNIAGSLAGAVEVSGRAIVLEYKAGPPVKLSFLRSSTPASAVLDEPVNIVLADAQWVQEAGTEHENTRKDTTVQFSIDNEEIGGQVREVLTLETNLAKGSGWRYAQIMLANETMVQTLQNGSGVRFKVLGDGKRWKLIIPTDEVNSDTFSYEIPIVTKKGKVVAIDVPYSKLKQPAWGKKVRFIKSSINSLQFQRNVDIGGTGPSTIKVFDLEIY